MLAAIVISAIHVLDSICCIMVNVINNVLKVLINQVNNALNALKLTVNNVHQQFNVLYVLKINSYLMEIVWTHVLMDIFHRFQIMYVNSVILNVKIVKSFLINAHPVLLGIL